MIVEEFEARDPSWLFLAGDRDPGVVAVAGEPAVLLEALLVGEVRALTHVEIEMDRIGGHDRREQ